MPIVLHANGVFRLAAPRAGFNLCAIVLLSIAPMIEAMQVFDEEWESWRGETKQIDDVLLIGIKF